MKLTVNMNDDIRVRLTPAGEKQWEKYWNTNPFWSEHIVPPAVRKAATLPDGRVHFQLWHAMEVFGSMLYNGCEIPFENNEIEIVS